ncbi:MAG: right-handed parallel beta-helix repeat-containing protein [Candidatus Saliniplasma sp.]
MINLSKISSSKILSFVMVLLLLATGLNISSLEFDKEGTRDPTIYSDPEDTIYVKGGNNTLKSIGSEVDDQSVFYYDETNSSAYCYANVTVEGWLDVEYESLIMDDKKTIRINSTGGLNMFHSLLKSVEEEKRWWEEENRYSIEKIDEGTLNVKNSTLKNIGWDDEEGKRGVEIYGTGFDLTNSTLKNGRNGLVLQDCGSVLEDTIENLTITDMDMKSVVITGTSTVKIIDSDLKNSGGVDIQKDGEGDLILVNSSFEDHEVSGEGYLDIYHTQDFVLSDEHGSISNREVEIFHKNNAWSKNYTTDPDGKIKDVTLLWRGVNETDIFKKTYGIRYDGNQTYFSPSNYNRVSIDFSEEARLYLTDVSVDPDSYIPVNNSLVPQNITVSVEGKNDLISDYHGNISFYWGDTYIDRSELDVLEGEKFNFSFDWTPDIEGYGKVRAVLDTKDSMSEDNLVSWSETFFAGYYNESIITYENFTEKSLEMLEHGVRNEDGEGHYTIYENWLPDVLMECGLSYFGAYEVTGNLSYYERGEKQFDYALGFRDQWGLYNRSTFYEVRGRFEDTYHEWSTHRNVRAALALQQAYLYTGNETYKNAADHMIDFILEKAARVNVTYHDGTDYSVFWESTEPNEGNGGIKGTSKNFTFLFVNGYIQLGRLLTQAYHDENINSSFYQNDSLLTHINTCMEYLINDQIDSGDSTGTWAYFSYYDEPDPWRRRSMIYAALTAKELARTNTYLHWQNISRAINNYTEYVEGRLDLRSAIDTHNGGNSNIMVLNHWRSLYNTTGRKLSKIEDFMFSNIYFNDDGTTNSYTLSSDRAPIDPHDYGFLYVHYNPLRTILWDKYYESRKDYFSLNLKYENESDGWNFLSTKLVPDLVDLEDILDHPDHGIEGSYDKVIWYDAEVKTWKSHIPDRDEHFNDWGSWDHRQGIWIRMLDDDELTIQGVRPYSTYIELHPGWNMVGYPSEGTKEAQESLPTEVTKVAVLNGSREYNIEYKYDLTNCSLDPGKGYWIFNSADEKVIWNVDYHYH